MSQQPQNQKSQNQQCQDQQSKGQQREDEFFMRMALVQAEEAAALGEVPVGAVLVFATSKAGAQTTEAETKATEAELAETTAISEASKISDEVEWAARVIALGHNCPIKSHDPTAHAEIEAIRKAAREASNYRLDGATLYVTLEPCTMCVGALVHARVRRVVFAASEPKAGALKSARALMDAEQSGYFNHRFEWQGGVLESEASDMLSAFFKQRRLKS